MDPLPAYPDYTAEATATNVEHRPDHHAPPATHPTIAHKQPDTSPPPKVNLPPPAESPPAYILNSAFLI